MYVVSPVSGWGAGTVGVENPPRNKRVDVFDVSNTVLGSIIGLSSLDKTTRGFVGFSLTTGAASSVVFVNTDTNNDVFGLDNIGFVTIPEPAGLLPTMVATVGIGLLFQRETLLSKRSQSRRATRQQSNC